MELESFNDKMNEAVFDTYEQAPERAHLGVSEVGHPCDKYLWLKFRWAVTPKREGRMLKLVKRGHLEEPILIEDLKKAGMIIEDNQIQVAFSNHFKGSADGIISNIPTAEKTRHLLEIKTSALKYFKQMIEKGVEASKPQHYIQMQLYMKGLKLERALYVVICKDDDRLWFERVYFNEDVADKYIERGRRIISSDRMPEPMINASVNWYECKYCPAFDFCHLTKKIKSENVNCRTCAFFTPMSDQCDKYKCNIDIDNQRKGCRAHVIHPDLTNWLLNRDKSSQFDAVYDTGFSEVVNGENGQDSKYLLSSEPVQKIVDVFEGSII